MGHSLPLFLYIRIFNSVDNTQIMFNINITDDWIRTADLWYRKQPLNQLYHNHCPFVIYDHGSFIILGIDVISLIIPRVRLLPVHLLPKKMRSIDSIEFYYRQFSSQ